MSNLALLMCMCVGVLPWKETGSADINRLQIDNSGLHRPTMLWLCRTFSLLEVS